MSIQSEIERLSNAKTTLAAAIEGKGVTVPESTKLDEMPALVESIQQNTEVLPHASSHGTGGSDPITPASIGAVSVESFDGLANYVDDFILNYPNYITPEGIGAAAASIGISATLLSSGWSGNVQTVTVDGVTASNNVVVAPAPANMQEYMDCAVYCSAQAANKLTFNCTSAPSADITVNVLIVG